ncbi:MAG: penicillin-binding transpeptidase domain-containing protein, partial [Gemmatimonadales bacterium]
EPRPGALRRDLGLSQEQLLILRRSMIEVVRSGTAARSRDQEIDMAGKTGTAQNPHGDNHGWFIGYAPADDPKIVVGMFTEFGQAGSAAAPHVARIIRRYLESIDPSLRGASMQYQVVADTAPLPFIVAPDSGSVIP